MVLWKRAQILFICGDIALVLVWPISFMTRQNWSLCRSIRLEYSVFYSVKILGIDSAWTLKNVKTWHWRYLLMWLVFCRLELSESRFLVGINERLLINASNTSQIPNIECIQRVDINFVGIVYISLQALPSSLLCARAAICFPLREITLSATCFSKVTSVFSTSYLMCS